jgi:hypothetical protein
MLHVVVPPNAADAMYMHAIFPGGFASRFLSFYGNDEVSSTESIHRASMACLLLRPHSGRRPSVSSYTVIDRAAVDCGRSLDRAWSGATCSWDVFQLGGESRVPEAFAGYMYRRPYLPLHLASLLSTCWSHSVFRSRPRLLL